MPSPCIIFNPTWPLYRMLRCDWIFALVISFFTAGSLEEAILFFLVLICCLILNRSASTALFLLIMYVLGGSKFSLTLWEVYVPNRKASSVLSNLSTTLLFVVVLLARIMVACRCKRED